MSVILAYHSICEEVENPFIQIEAAALARQLSWVEQLGYRWTTLDEALESPRERLAALTFDDGLRDFHVAAELLVARSLPVTLFVCPGLVGQESDWTSSPALRERPLLDLAELTELARAGVELTSHGWTHRRIPTIDPPQLDREMAQCVQWFERHLGIQPSTLAYPYGECDFAHARIVAQHYPWALAVDPLTDVPLRWAVPRMTACARDDRGAFAKRLARYELADYDLARWSSDRAELFAGAYSGA